MNKIIKKILTVIICFTILTVGTGNAYAQSSETIEEIADNLIDFTIEESDSNHKI